MTRKPRSVTVLEATQDSPTLARLAELAVDSSARLKAIQSLIPASLRPAIQAGPIEGLSWCLILDNAAVAAKLRQLLPALQAHLQSKGWEINSIRLKVQMSRNNL